MRTNWRQGSYPVFSAGLNPCGPTKSVAGRVNLPVSVAGASIEPGDLVVGDADGVVVIPRDRRRPHRRSRGEKAGKRNRAASRAFRKGDLRPGWLEKELRAAGMLAEGEAL